MIEKITCRTQEQRRRPSGFSGKYYLKAVEIFHRKLSMSLTGEAERSYLRTCIFAVMEPGHVIVTGCRCRNSEVRPSATAEGVPARPHPAPVMGGKAAGGQELQGRGRKEKAWKRTPASGQGAGTGGEVPERRQGYLRRVFGYFLHRKYPDFCPSPEKIFPHGQKSGNHDVRLKKKAKGF